MSTTDATHAVALGPHGEVYEPDARGGWSRRRPVRTADPLTRATPAGDAVVALGDGVVYRLADNGWTALRLHQRQRAVMSSGQRAIAAVGRQLFTLAPRAGGAPAKLGLAPAAVEMIGASADAITIATDRGVWRSTGGAFRALPRAPRRVDQLVSDRWALVDGGAIDLDTGIVTAWPADTRIEVAALGPSGSLLAVARTGGRLQLLTLPRPSGKALRSAQGARQAGRRAVAAAETAPAETIPVDGGGPTGASVAVGVVADAAGGAVVALADGRLAVRDRGSWRLVGVSEALGPNRPGPAPARAP